jgi:hypothetical protein
MLRRRLTISYMEVSSRGTSLKQRQARIVRLKAFFRAPECGLNLGPVRIDREQLPGACAGLLAQLVLQMRASKRALTGFKSLGVNAMWSMTPVRVALREAAVRKTASRKRHG